MPTDRAVIRIFVSSPGDVSSERFVAEKVIQRVQEEFRDVCQLEPIFWEHEPLTASASFQEELISPAATDIVVCILWSRLGTRLPKKVTGQRNLTGTEYEFEEALRSRNERGIPHLLVYRKTARPIADLSDRQRRKEAIEQIEALEAFIDRWFHDEAGALVAAFHPFDDSATFEEHLAHHLRKLVERRLSELGIDLRAAGPQAVIWSNDSPFRGLAVFEPEHAPIYFGRTKAVGEAVDQLRRLVAAQRGFLLILGSSGSGKSSMVRAGMIPLLTQPNVIEGIREFRYVVVRPATAQSDLFEMLTSSLSSALPELLEDGTTEQQLADCMRSNPAVLVGLIKGALALAASRSEAGSSAEQRIGVLIVIDQLEELFTVLADQPQVASQLADLLHELTFNRMSRTLVIATLRSDFYHKLLEQPKLAAMQDGDAQYVLQPPTVSEISQIIRLPAQAAGLRFEENLHGARLDDALIDEAAHDPSILPLLEFTLDELYRLTDETRLLTFANYEALGGVGGALAKRAEAVFVSQSPEVQAAFSMVFRELVTFSHSADNVATACIAPVHRFESSASQAQLVQELINARLLVSDRDADGKAIVRVAHESLLQRWSRLSEWLRQNQRLLKSRERVAAAAARWLAENRPRDLLLPQGKPLQEADELLAMDLALAPEAQQFIRASRQKAERQRLGWKSLQLAVILAIVTGSAVSIKFGLDAYKQSEIAKTKSDQVLAASKQLDEANRSLNHSLSRALRGPIGAGDMDMMNDAETEALRELAGLRTTFDAEQFLSEFMQTEDTAKRMAKRGSFVIQAVIAGDPVRRKQFEQLMRSKLSNKELSKEHQWMLALVWHQSECANAEIDALVAPLLAEQVTVKSAGAVDRVKALLDVVDRLPAEQGAPLVNQASQVLFDRLGKRKLTLFGLHFDIEAYILIEDRIPKETSAEWNRQLAERFELALRDNKEWSDRSSMSKWIAPFLLRTEAPRDQLLKAACEALLDELANTRESIKLSQIANELGAIAACCSPDEATKLCDQVARRLIAEIMKTKDISAAGSLGSGLQDLGKYLSAELLRNEFYELITNARSATTVGYAAEASAEALNHLDESDAKEISVQFAPVLVSVFDKVNTGYWSEGLSKGIHSMLSRMDESDRAELASRVSKRLIDLTPSAVEVESSTADHWAKCITNLLPWIGADDRVQLSESVDELIDTKVEYRNPFSDTHLGMALNQASDLAECRLQLAQALRSSDVDKWREHLCLQELEMVPSLNLSYVYMPDYPDTSLNILQESVRDVDRLMRHALLDYDHPLSKEFLYKLLDHPFCVSVARQAVLTALSKAEGRTLRDRWDVHR